jgi:mannose-1-phosphate guanylyltransferase/mannose-6-phosphate isomerase
LTQDIHPVLLCGGSGTRLWPLSRKSFPKQFACFAGDHSLFQASALRLAAPGFAAPLIVTGSDYRFIVTEQLAAAEIAPATILIEPEARNTAPAICAAAIALHDRAPGALMLVAPSDHVIPDADAFRAAVVAATPIATEGRIVTFGIRPDRAETGYGWLELPEAIIITDETGPQPVKGFVEKPDASTAQQMLGDGRHLWNAGFFLFSTDAILAAFEAHASEMLAMVRTAWQERKQDLGFTRLAPQAWATLQDLSIDYAVMEKTDNLSVMPYAGRWSDLGVWDAVWHEAGPDADGVACHGPATAIDCTNVLLRAESDDQPLVAIGIENIVAIAMPDAVLITHKDRTQDVKLAVSTLKAHGVPQAETLPRDFRPWGWFESLVIGKRFQVKRIHVNPGAALSLQSHHHRSEHWIVVEGTARVTIGEEVQLLTENQSVYIPLGAVHRMENPGKVPMVLIEVQTGSYLGENDIVRYEDIYARC